MDLDALVSASERASLGFGWFSTRVAVEEEGSGLKPWDRETLVFFADFVEGCFSLLFWFFEIPQAFVRLRSGVRDDEIA